MNGTSTSNEICGFEYQFEDVRSIILQDECGACHAERQSRVIAVKGLLSVLKIDSSKPVPRRRAGEGHTRHAGFSLPALWDENDRE
jgi:hypothetical protein